MLEEIKEILSEYRGEESDHITEDTTFEELGLDSLDTAELVMSLEDKYHVSLELDESIKTIGDLIRLIRETQEKA